MGRFISKNFVELIILIIIISLPISLHQHRADGNLTTTAFTHIFQNLYYYQNHIFNYGYTSTKLEKSSSYKDFIILQSNDVYYEFCAERGLVQISTVVNEDHSLLIRIDKTQDFWTREFSIESEKYPIWTNLYLTPYLITSVDDKIRRELKYNEGYSYVDYNIDFSRFDTGFNGGGYKADDFIKSRIATETLQSILVQGLQLESALINLYLEIQPTI
ncbi:MAG: hypothetical protein ATN36_08765 [Epulopiscium sp. Nele67-Bin005]|nr:MAG: hypothetical protein ATN36_08765 [Epulopiscium sp. Nele67-Bin005]